MMRPVSARSATRPWPAIWKRRAVPPESGTTPCSTSGSRMRALSPAMRMSQSSARSKEPPITQPLSAATIGQGIVKNCCVPLWPRSMNSRSVMSSVRTPSSLGVATRRERLAVAAPHDAAQAVLLVQLGEQLPEARVHLVVRGVVPVGPVVREDRHRSVVFERDRVAAHALLPLKTGARFSAKAATASR